MKIFRRQKLKNGWGVYFINQSTTNIHNLNSSEKIWKRLLYKGYYIYTFFFFKNFEKPYMYILFIFKSNQKIFRGKIEN